MSTIYKENCKIFECFFSLLTWGPCRYWTPFRWALGFNQVFPNQLCRWPFPKERGLFL